MNIIEVICCAILVGLPLAGYLKGFVKTITPLASSLLSLFVIYVLRDWGFAFLFQWIFFQGQSILPRVVVVLLFFVLGAVGFRAIFVALNIFSKIPLIKGANRLLGLVLGGALAVLVVWSILYCVSIFKTTSFGIAGLEAVSKNEILLYLYRHNFIEQYMGMFTSL